MKFDIYFGTRVHVVQFPCWLTSIMSGLKTIGLLSVQICPERLVLGGLTVSPARRLLGSWRLQLPNAAHLGLLDPSSYVLSEEAGKSFARSCSKSLLLVLSIDANTVKLRGAGVDACRMEDGAGYSMPRITHQSLSQKHKISVVVFRAPLHLPPAGALDRVSSEPSEIKPVSLWASLFVYVCRPASVSWHHKLILSRQKYLGSQIIAL